MVGYLSMTWLRLHDMQEHHCVATSIGILWRVLNRRVFQFRFVSFCIESLSLRLKNNRCFASWAHSSTDHYFQGFWLCHELNYYHEYQPFLYVVDQFGLISLHHRIGKSWSHRVCASQTSLIVFVFVQQWALASWSLWHYVAIASVLHDIRSCGFH